MTATRIVAGIAAVLTVLLLQATLIAPVSLPIPISLPAVLVAAVALHAGAGTGMSLGFSAGLLADLGSSHPAGVLALVWLGLGIACGMIADPSRPLLRQALLVAVLGGVAAGLATVLLAVVDPGGSPLWYAAPCAAGDLLLALLILPAVRAFLRTDAMRAPRVPRERRVMTGG